MKILETTSWGTKILFCIHRLIFFSSLRGACTNSETTLYLLSYLFWLKTLKDTAKTPAVDALRINTPGDTKRLGWPLKGTTTTPVLLIWEYPPGRVGRSNGNLKLRWLEIVFIFPRLVLQILLQIQFGLSYKCEIYHTQVKRHRVITTYFSRKPVTMATR